MAVSITKIQAEGAGPIQKISLKPKRFNLVYGRNEQGKTFLTEFIIRSLFSGASQRSLRPGSAQGKITVSGLEQKPVQFSPGSPHKLEDFLAKDTASLPPDLSRLLVVKGAELELSGNPADNDKAIVRKYISQKDILERIDRRIPATEKTAVFENGVLVTKRQGIGRDIETLSETYKETLNLLDQVNRTVSGGIRAQLEAQYRKAQDDIGVMEHAKRYLAYTLYENKEALERSIHEADQEGMDRAAKLAASCRYKERDIQRKKKDMASAEKGSREYVWLKKFQDEYARLSGSARPDAPKLPLIIGICMCVAGMAGGFAAGVSPLIVSMAFLAGLGALLWYTWMLRRSMSAALNNKDMAALEHTFREKFNRSYTAADVQELLDRLEPRYQDYSAFSRDIPREEEELERLADSLIAAVHAFSGRQCTLDTAENVINETRAHIKHLDNEHRRIENRLAGLQVERKDAADQPADKEFSSREYADLKALLQQLKMKLDEEQKNLYELKSRVAAHVGQPVSSSWDECIDRLRSLRLQYAEELRRTKARAIAGNRVHRVIMNLAKSEDQKLKERLASSDINTTVRSLTGRYSSITLNNDDLVVSDGFHDFPVSSLSTGAQEQILLCLRVSFAKQLLGDRQLFLILDDAFQYSDWNRREFLVQGVSALAEAGWQIIYFTMDDHIRDLFDKAGRRFGSEYVSHTLA